MPLSKDKNTWEDIFNSINDSITIHDNNFNIIMMNKAAQELFENFKIEEIINKPCYLLYHGSNQPPQSCPSCQTARTGIPCTTEIFEPHLNKFLEIKAFPRLDENKNIIGLVHIVRDITQRKKVEEEKIKLQNQLFQTQKMETFGKLTGGIAHDFNNILTPIIGYTDLALEDSPKDTSTYKNLQKVYSSAIAAKNLIEQLLIFSRQSNNERKPVEVTTIINDVLKLIRSSFPTTIKVICKNNLKDKLIMADSVQIKQLLMNICTNSLYAMKQEGGTLELLTEAVSLEDTYLKSHSNLKNKTYISITIKDTGIGIPDTIINKIFDPFYTTKKIGEGSGLGLSVALGIALNHNGDILIESKVGQGTTVKIYLPLLIQEQAAENDANVISLINKSLNIMFVDDQPDICNVLEQLILKLGYNIRTFSSSMKALKEFVKSPDSFDVIITDQTMPELTGMELSRKIRDIKNDIKIILTTGFNEKVNVEELVDYGINRLIMKPIQLKDLREAIESVMLQKKQGN
ncbi:MAG: multi-sensor hybrid histidine kinase [uncultured bacterium]|nr:MAG: multi-sensor hybrid histidine kinase [uncultured bacterium]